jgi:transglutaminase-like putative cysteine protease
VSGLAAVRVDEPLRARAVVTRKPMLPAALLELLWKLATFGALGAFALGHWAAVLQHPPFGPAAALLALCLAGGALIWATGRLPLPLVAVRALAAALVLGLAVLSLLVAGLPSRYLVPHRWDTLGIHLNHGLLLAQSAFYPYSGGDHWTRITLALGGPVFMVPATALAFWPAKKAGPILRGAALVVLIVLYGYALAELSPRGQIGRGFALLVLVAAWLWLPRMKGRDAITASAAVLVAALVALPVAAKLDSSSGWIDYRNWHVLGQTAGLNYQWNQTYGPITWPRRGTTLLYVRSGRPYYWKAETLNDFNGRAWFRNTSDTGVGPGSELPAAPDSRWIKAVQFTVAGLRGNLVVGAGTPQSVRGVAGNTEYAGDGTVRALDHPLHDGENYSVTTYVPDPTAAEMRAVPQSYEGYFGIYTKIVVPTSMPGQPRGQLVRVDPGLWDGSSANGGDPVAPSEIEHSPYAPMYRLAKRLTAGAPTSYDAALRIERYLNSTRFTYDEQPALHKYPLESFLIKDKAGYCQQFSGTMALMLRMLGIPARVASGFAPGTPEPDSPGVYRVRDFDAHAWVEVYFPDIGWVTFDPTPSVSPASLQNDDRTGAIGTNTIKPGGNTQAGGARSLAAADATGGPRHEGGSLPWWTIVLGLVAIAIGALAALRTRAVARRRALLSPEERALADLRHALDRLGYPVGNGATLLTVERLLERRAGFPAADYVRRLRDHRYGGNGAVLPGRRERRLLRRALAATVRPFGRLKALRALPPAHC